MGNGPRGIKTTTIAWLVKYAASYAAAGGQEIGRK